MTTRLQLLVSTLATFILVTLLSSPSVQAMSIPSSPSSKLAIRVVSYNVLSSHLASPSHYSTLDPAHLDASYRLPLILDKLDQEIKTSPKVVVCLQEVSYDWASDLHVFFANRGFHLVTGLYGKKFNGYMGVAVAYPTNVFETVNVDICRLADKRVGGWPKEPSRALSTRVIASAYKYFWNKPLTYLGLFQRGEENPWNASKRRFNVLLSTTLQDKESKQEFCIGNYHMPCCYYNPPVMTIHSEMAMHHVQNVAKDSPCILAGDFNIKPEAIQYEMMTKGTTMDPEENDNFPPPLHGMTWKMQASPMRSAYAEAAGKEPDFTNYARIGEQEPFIDTLDYILVSKEWNVKSTKPLMHRAEANGPFPNAVEPSDHIMIAADLEVGGDGQ